MYIKKRRMLGVAKQDAQREIKEMMLQMHDLLTKEKPWLAKYIVEQA